MPLEGPASAPILVPYRNDPRFGLDAGAAAQVVRLKLRRDSGERLAPAGDEVVGRLSMRGAAEERV